MTHSYRRAFTKTDAHRVDLGLRIQDTVYLDRYDNNHSPEVNVIAPSISDEEDGEEEIKGPDYVCANCENILDHNNILTNLYSCRRCTKFYDITKDRLLTRSDLEEDGVIYVSNELRTYKYDKFSDYKEAGSKTIPIMFSINPDTLDTDEARGYEIVRQSADKRIEHRRVTDYNKLTEALQF